MSKTKLRFFALLSFLSISLIGTNSLDGSNNHYITACGLIIPVFFHVYIIFYWDELK